MAKRKSEGSPLIVDDGEVRGDLDSHVQLVRTDQPSFKQVLEQGLRRIVERLSGAGAIDQQSHHEVVRRLPVPRIDRHLDPVAIAPHFTKPSLENVKPVFLLSGFDLPGDSRRDAVAHDVPAGAVIPGELLLFRDGEVAPDALSERAKLVHDQGGIHPVRPEPGAVLFHERHELVQAQCLDVVRREQGIVAPLEVRQRQEAGYARRRKSSRPTRACAGSRTRRSW